MIIHSLYSPILSPSHTNTILNASNFLNIYDFSNKNTRENQKKAKFMTTLVIAEND